MWDDRTLYAIWLLSWNKISNFNPNILKFWDHNFKFSSLVYLICLMWMYDVYKLHNTFSRGGKTMWQTHYMYFTMKLWNMNYVAIQTAEHLEQVHVFTRPAYKIYHHGWAQHSDITTRRHNIDITTFLTFSIFDHNNFQIWSYQNM